MGTWTQPKLTADDSYGAVTVSSAGADRPGWKALDGIKNDPESCWESAIDVTSGWLMWQLPAWIMIKKITLYNKYTGNTRLSKDVAVYADEGKTIPIGSAATFPQESYSSVEITPSRPVMTNCIYIDLPNSYNLMVGLSEIEIDADTVPDYDGLDGLLNTTAGMEVLVNNVKKDDDTITVPGVDWFKFNGAALANLYASGNHWIGIGASAENLKVCRRDGAMYYLYRQEGTIYGYYRFLKVRWEGYTQYNSTDVSRKLVYEFFLFSTGDMFLNVIQTPTNSSYIGASSLTCGSNTYTLEIPVGSAPQICFNHQDDAGSTWEIRYEQIVIEPPWLRKWLVRDKAGTLYALSGEALTPLDAVELTSQVMLDSGMDAPPAWELMAQLEDPAVLCWQDAYGKPVMTAAITAVPYNQTLYTDDYDMAHESIVGIENIVVEADENTLFAISFDSGVTWQAYDGTAWVILSEEQSGMAKATLESIGVDAWAEVATTGKYRFRFTLLEGGWVKSIVVNYVNKGE